MREKNFFFFFESPCFFQGPGRNKGGKRCQVHCEAKASPAVRIHGCPMQEKKKHGPAPLHRRTRGDLNKTNVAHISTRNHREIKDEG